MKTAKPIKKPLSVDQKIKLLIKKRNSTIIEALRAENKCNHQWVKSRYGYICENCDYYCGHDGQLKQLISKAIKKGR